MVKVKSSLGWSTKLDSNSTITDDEQEEEEVEILQQVQENVDAVDLIIAAMSVGIQPETVLPPVPTEEAVLAGTVLAPTPTDPCLAPAKTQTRPNASYWTNARTNPIPEANAGAEANSCPRANISPAEASSNLLANTDLNTSPDGSAPDDFKGNTEQEEGCITSQGAARFSPERLPPHFKWYSYPRTSATAVSERQAILKLVDKNEALCKRCEVLTRESEKDANKGSSLKRLTAENSHLKEELRAAKQFAL